MENPCLECKTRQFCHGSRDVLKKPMPGQEQPLGPCEPFNQYVLSLRGQKAAAKVIPNDSG